MALVSLQFNERFTAQSNRILVAADAQQRVRVRGLTIISTVQGGIGLQQTGGAGSLWTGQVNAREPVTWPLCAHDDEYVVTDDGRGISLTWSIAGTGYLQGVIEYEQEAVVAAANTANA
jgi:hypothetical protein